MKSPDWKRGKMTRELADFICSQIADGRTLREVCREHGYNRSTVGRWVIENRKLDDDDEGFSVHYARSQEMGIHAMVEEVIEISDDGRNDWMLRNDPDNPGYQLNSEHISRSRLRVDSRKWLASKIVPKIYGDKVTNQTNLQALDENGQPTGFPSQFSIVGVAAPNTDT